VAFRVRGAAAVAVAAIAVAGCGSAAAPPAADQERLGLPLGALPAEGVVEQAEGKVVVRALDGTVATELPAMRLDEASSPLRPPRLVERDGTAFRLADGRLTEDPSQSGDVRFSGDGTPPKLPEPAAEGPGHWRYAFAARDGRVLAQWSGECELPTAYLVDGGRPVALSTGGAHVESVALGMSLDGSPVVLFPVPGCGTGSVRTGVHVLDAAGRWRQITPATAARYFRRDAADVAPTSGAPAESPSAFADCDALRPGDPLVRDTALNCDNEKTSVTTLDCSDGIYVFVSRRGPDDLEGIIGVTAAWRAATLEPTHGKPSVWAFEHCIETDS
jgi:hypothetical protein